MTDNINQFPEVNNNTEEEQEILDDLIEMLELGHDHIIMLEEGLGEV